MKRLTSLFLKTLCVFTFIIITNCGEEKTNQQGKEIEVIAPAQIIPVAQAESFYTNYTKRRVKLIEKYEDSLNRIKEYDNMRQQKIKKSTIVTPKDSFTVARYVSYDYETIKQYLAYVEQEAKKANVEVSSLRFYFSNYPDKKTFDNGEKVYHPRQNSIMISPTLKKDDKEFLFYISNLDEKRSQALLLSDEFENLDVKGMGNTINSSTKSYASFAPFIATTSPLQTEIESLTMNRGSGAPPNQNEE